jgi:16S rRNA (adenine1518-N6/adenine1519-N6)-dimethyltransferase
MNLYSKKIIKDLFKKYQIRPIKSMGQNFLINEEVIKRIIEAADLNPKDIILEIGPGIGTLTQEIAKKAGKVIAIEKDPKMVEILKKTLKNFNNIEIIQDDILKMQNTNLKMQNDNVKFKIVANLPYYIVSPVIRKFLELTRTKPILMVLMVQKEVAQRICARPPDMSILAISVQFYAKPKIISYVSKKSFWPQPKVDSAIIIIKRKAKSEKRKINKDLFFQIVKSGFSQPRKQLINNLTKRLKIDKIKIREWLLKSKIQPSQRAETLSIEDWVNLTKNYKIKQ